MERVPCRLAEQKREKDRQKDRKKDRKKDREKDLQEDPYGTMTYGSTTYQKCSVLRVFLVLHHPPGPLSWPSQLAPGPSQLAPGPSQLAPGPS